MTRINIIPPRELYDQHLIAEYREMLMVPASLKRTLASKQGLQLHKIPKTFPLNTEVFKQNNLYNDWTPTPAEQLLIRQRITERVNQRPGWYRKTK